MKRVGVHKHMHAERRPKTHERDFLLEIGYGIKYLDVDRRHRETVYPSDLEQSKQAPKQEKQDGAESRQATAVRASQ